MDKLDTYAMCAAMRAQSQPSLRAARQLTNNEWLTIQTNRSAEYEISIDQTSAKTQQTPKAPVSTAAARPAARPAAPAIPVVRPPTYLREIHARHNQVKKK